MSRRLTKKTMSLFESIKQIDENGNEYWSAREQWESKIRIALGAKPGEFEARWGELETTMNGIIDVKAFEDACTEAFQPYLDALLGE